MEHSYVIEKNDLTLRPISFLDIEQIRLWRNQSNNRRWFVHQDKISREMQEKWFAHYLETDNDMMFVGEWHGRPIGTAALYNINKKMKSAEFGRLIIGEETERGQGLGKIMTNMICHFGLTVLELNRIELEVFKENEYAIKIYEKVGFFKKGEYILNGQCLYEMSLINKKSLYETEF